MMKTDYTNAKTTPMMKQWVAIKEKLSKESPEGDEPIVFCRVGDFYELFYDDAIRASKILDIQLTQRKIADTHYPMAGVPVRSLEGYVARLVNGGHRVAIIDQMEDAKKAKGTINRELTRIVTKGTITEDSMLNPGKNNYIAAISPLNIKNSHFGFAVMDLSTGDFRADEFDDKDKALRAFIKYAPVEVLYSQDNSIPGLDYGIQLDQDEVLTAVNPFWFEDANCKSLLLKQFNVSTLQGFGISEGSQAIRAAGAIIKYIQETQFISIPHVHKIQNFDIESTMTLDATAINGLELFRNTNDNTSFATLYELMNETVTPMGSRLLRHWIANPLADKLMIEERFNAVQTLLEEELIQHSIRSKLSTVGDLERLITRISIGRAKPIELVRLADSLESLPELLSNLSPIAQKFPENLINQIDTCDDLVHLIRKTIRNNPEGAVGEGKIIRKGYNEELDRLRAVMTEGQKWIDKYIAKELKEHDITFKIKQNNTFGYFIEVSKKELVNVPSHFVRKQVMVNVTRFFTEDLKNWEEDILLAEIKILDLESTIYKNVLKQMASFTAVLQLTSNAIARIDCLSSHAFLADMRSYCKPSIRDDRSFILEEGRHPVIENIASQNAYIPNDVKIEYEKSRVQIITGPNFSGKSSLLRMVALLVIMAQTGSFVPAANLSLGIIDRIFTRIGASDNLVAGQSTFMMEMIDAANLVNNSTENSLIIADELGRGTSTYDGLAIAWSIAEFLHNSDNPPKALIASHYHQLSELEGILRFCVNYHFSIRFDEDQPIFDHKLIRGSSDKSFGVEVAKLAGLPSKVVDRARTILKILESKASDVNPDGISSKNLGELVLREDGIFDTWFDSDHEKQETIISAIPTESEIHKLLSSSDINSMTPLEALQFLSKLKELL